MERASGAMINVAGTWGLILLTIMGFYLYAQPSFHILPDRAARPCYGKLIRSEDHCTFLMAGNGFLLFGSYCWTVSRVKASGFILLFLFGYILASMASCISIVASSAGSSH